MIFPSEGDGLKIIEGEKVKLTLKNKTQMFLTQFLVSFTESKKCPSRLSFNTDYNVKMLRYTHFSK